MAKKPRRQKDSSKPVKMGRPTLWRPDFPKLAYRYALLGATDKKIYEWLGVSERIFYQWLREKPEFSQALTRGRSEADANVAHSMYRSATGYYKKTEKATKDGAVTVREWNAPNTSAGIFWLKNRQRDTWRDKQDVDHTHTLTLAQEFEQLVREISTGSKTALPAPAIDITPERSE